MSPKYVVTGGAGFIGSTIVRALLREGVTNVTVIDNLSTGKEENLADVRTQIQFHHLDIRETRDVESVLKGAKAVFHQAAIPSVPRSVSEPELCHGSNIDGTFSVFTAAQRAGVGRVVYAASSAAYGNNPELPKRETMLPEPMSPYAVQKLVGEYYAAAFSTCYGLETVCIRYFNVFGPRQDPKSPYSGVLSLFLDAALAGRAPTIFGDGEQSRDFIFVEDVARLNLLASKADGVSGRVFNGGTGGRITVNEAWRTIARQLGVKLDPTYAPPRTGDVLHSQADISETRRALGFEPQYDFADGIAQTIQWIKAYNLVAA